MSEKSNKKISEYRDGHERKWVRVQAKQFNGTFSTRCCPLLNWSTKRTDVMDLCKYTVWCSFETPWPGAGEQLLPLPFLFCLLMCAAPWARRKRRECAYEELVVLLPSSLSLSLFLPFCACLRRWKRQKRIKGETSGRETSRRIKGVSFLPFPLFF